MVSKLSQMVKVNDKLFRCFPVRLTSTIEVGPLKNYVSCDLEEQVKLFDHRIVHLLFFLCDISRC